MKDIDNNAIDILVKEICKSIKKVITNASFNKGFTGRVVNIIDDNNYVVHINQEEFYVKSRFKLNIGDVVKIISLNNDINELYVIY